MNQVLVIAAHPDDEILGIGGTAARHVLEGDTVDRLILGEGQTSRWPSSKAPSHLVKELQKDSKQAGQIIGYRNMDFAQFPDNRFDKVDLLEIIQVIEKKIKDFQPNLIYTHFGGDLNIDHQRTFQAVQTATRPLSSCPVKQIYCFETLSSTEWNFSGESRFQPNYFVNIEKTIEKKKQAMACYSSELCQFPHPRSLEGITLSARMWGAVSGLNHAEAFQLVRAVQN